MDVIMRKLLVFNNLSRKEMIMKKFVIIVFLVIVTILNVHADNEWQVNKIVHDENYIYIGTENVGLISIDKENGEQTQYASEWEDYYKRISDLSMHNGKLYSINKYYKLGILEEGKIKYESLKVEGIRPNRMFPHLAWDSKGVLWTNMELQFIMYYGRKTFVGQFDSESENDCHWIGEEMIRSLAIDEDVVWFTCSAVGTHHNFARFSNEDGITFPAYHTDLGHAVLAIKIDANHNKWLATTNGIICFDQSENLTLYELAGVKYDLAQLEDGSFLVPNNKDLYLFKDKEFSLLCENAAGKTIMCVDAVGDTYYFGTEDGLFKLEGGKVTQIPLLGQTVDIEEPVSVQQAKVSQRTFDLQGRQVMGETDAESEKESLPKGMYVNKGKKFIAK